MPAVQLAGCAFLPIEWQPVEIVWIPTSEKHSLKKAHCVRTHSNAVLSKEQLPTSFKNLSVKKISDLVRCFPAKHSRIRSSLIKQKFWLHEPASTTAAIMQNVSPPPSWLKVDFTPARCLCGPQCCHDNVNRAQKAWSQRRCCWAIWWS